jgi:two-component system, OmpR family, sensor histidine kinase KdpD
MKASSASTVVLPQSQQAWLVKTIVPEILGYDAIAVEMGAGPAALSRAAAKHIEAMLAEVAVTFRHLKVKEAVERATINYQTEILRDALIGGVSHELRSPLTSILGSCGVLSEMASVANDRKSHTLVETIHDQALRLDDAICDLLDATRITANGVRAQMVWTDPTDIVSAAVKQKQRHLSAHTVVLDVQPDLPLVYVDSVLVEQALGQLLENAAKYSPVGTAIKISSSHARNHVDLAVADRGAGLTAEEKNQLGQRSFRGERHAASVGGSGLGLWIASSFIAANGGSLLAESEGPNLGTTITLRLPTVSENKPGIVDAVND